MQRFFGTIAALSRLGCKQLPTKNRLAAKSLASDLPVVGVYPKSSAAASVIARTSKR